MSLKKQDPALRVAANDPHLVSLGGGRLSTAVTIHYIPIGDMTIGSESNCSISLNGSGVLSLHCTLYRSEQNEVTIVPEFDARILIDNNRITTETNLTQGAMITIGNSNYLRFNNPAEAQLIRSAMGSNDRISMPQIDFNQEDEDENKKLNTSICNGEMYSSFHEFYESKISSYQQQKQQQHTEGFLDKITKAAEYINVNNFHSPKVFAADSITVNAPAKDVLGPKYASFAKNLVENNKNDKNTCTKNNEINIKNSNYVNIPPSFIQNSPNNASAGNNDILAKVNNNNNNNLIVRCGGNNSQQYSSTIAAYDRYPKPGSYGGLQLFPMNGVNSEINANNTSLPIATDYSNLQYPSGQQQQHDSKMSPQEQERIDEILKICTEYDKQNQSNQSITSSPIVQNRIKTNGSLPREKKSPFHHHDLSPHIQNGQQQQHNNKVFFPDKFKPNTGYENVRFIGDRRVEIGNNSPLNTRKSGYENVAGKYVPQSPRTKIKTICMPTKKDQNIGNLTNGLVDNSSLNNNSNKSNEYAQLIQSFEDKLKLEMQAIKENSKIKDEKKNEIARKRTNINVNNLKLDISSNSVDETETPKKENIMLKELQKKRELVLSQIRKLKTHIAEIQRQEEEVLRELDMEKALVSAELSSVTNLLSDIEKKLSSLQKKFHRLEAQRNSNRVMQETRQTKLKQTIEMKQEQVTRLENYVVNNPTDKTLRGELENCIESLENDTKMFEDLEFQYLEEETEWLAYREELCNEIKQLKSDIEERQLTISNLEEQGVNNQDIACSDTKTLENDLLSLLTALEKNREELQYIDKEIFDISGQQQSQSDQSDDEDFNIENKNRKDGNVLNTIMSQSLFGSAEILCTKQHNQLMSRSVNENMFYNNNIEILKPVTSSTPIKVLPINDLINYNTINSSFQNNEKSPDHFDITAEIVCRENNKELDPILKLKYNVDGCKSDSKQQNQGNLNLSLGSDDFEVNPLERRIPSQDDIDRICKVTTDAPISTQGASNKIFESIKEIERNRQLLLAQQGSHVIEHERQKILELKKKCHDEARAQYLSLHSEPNNSQTQNSQETIEKPPTLMENTTSYAEVGKEKEESIQRYSHPAQLESQRPLSEGNSELSYDHLSEKPFISNTDLLSTSYNFSGNSEDTKRSSAISNETDNSDKFGSSGNRRPPLQKHQRPLTRYLPISSPYLDLKLHIESSGHQLAVCPHVFVDSYSCRGYLHKLGSTFHAWSRRWFVLDRQRRAFIYYADKNEKKPRGGACFPTIDEVYLDHFNTSKSGRPSCTFIVKTKKRSYNLQAASDAAARIWIDAIITGAHGNTEYD